MKPLYPPPHKVRRSPLPMLLLAVVVILAGAIWYLSSSARPQPLTTIETDVTANAAS